MGQGPGRARALPYKPPPLTQTVRYSNLSFAGDTHQKTDSELTQTVVVKSIGLVVTRSVMLKMSHVRGSVGGMESE